MADLRLSIRPDELRRRRLEKVLTREELAVKSGISNQRIQMLEVGMKPFVAPTTAQALARALDCDPTEITEVVDAEAVS